MDFCNVTISNTTQPVTTGRNFTVSHGTMTVNNGATFNTGAFVVSGGGTFTLAAGGTLGIGNANGITTVGTASGSHPDHDAQLSRSAATTPTTEPARQNTGTGYPTNLTGTLTINNPGNTVTLSAAQDHRQHRHREHRRRHVRGRHEPHHGEHVDHHPQRRHDDRNAAGGRHLQRDVHGQRRVDDIERNQRHRVSPTSRLSDTVVVTAGAAITTATNGVLTIGSGTTFIQAGSEFVACSGNNLSIGQHDRDRGISPTARPG